MHVNMYNVEFGDCFLICGEEENLLVDFGSDNPHCDITAIANHIKATNSTKDLSCLISHFHEDHISGFLQGLLTAEKIYIPDIVAMSKTVGKLSFLQLSILSDIFKWIPVKQTRRLSITLYDLLLKICDHNTHVHFLQRGTHFTISAKEYQVLWPDFSSLAIHGRVERRIVDTLAELGLISQQIAKECKHPSKGEKSGQLIVNEAYLKDPLPIAIIDPFITKLVEGYTALANTGQPNQSFDKAQLQAAYDKLVEDVKAALSNITESTFAKGNLKQDLSELGESMKKQANKYSVVFHDTPENGLSSILMTGDVTPPEFNKLLTHRMRGIPQISMRYNIIKAPHHATTTYFTPHLPQCGVILASNGRPNKGHGSWHKICYHYGSFYQSHKGVKMLCSNLRCDLRDLPETPNCNNCGDQNYIWNGDSVTIISP